MWSIGSESIGPASRLSSSKEKNNLDWKQETALVARYTRDYYSSSETKAEEEEESEWERKNDTQRAAEATGMRGEKEKRGRLESAAHRFGREKFCSGRRSSGHCLPSQTSAVQKEGKKGKKQRTNHAVVSTMHSLSDWGSFRSLASQSGPNDEQQRNQVDGNNRHWVEESWVESSRNVLHKYSCFYLLLQTVSAL